MDDWFDRDKRRKRRDIFDFFDEIFKEFNEMIKNFMNVSPDDINREPKIKGFSIYMGPDGIDVRDLSGRPININKSIFEDKIRPDEYKELDYDMIRKGDKVIYYIDLTGVPARNISVDKNNNMLIIRYDGKISQIRLPNDLINYKIEDYKVGKGILTIVMKKKAKSIFRF